MVRTPVLSFMLLVRFQPVVADYLTMCDDWIGGVGNTI